MNSDAASLDQRKAVMREGMKAVLGAMDAPTRERRSGALRARLEGLSAWRDCRCPMVFAPMASEPDLEPLLVAAMGQGKRLAVPRVDWPTGMMEPTLIGDWRKDLVADRKGLRGPREGLWVVPRKELDLLLVPGLVFDAGGGRLGRGAGFYDRFLAAGLSCLSVAIAFELQVVDETPCGSDDWRVDLIVTDERVIECRGARRGPPAQPSP